MWTFKKFEAPLSSPKYVMYIISYHLKCYSPTWPYHTYHACMHALVLLYCMVNKYEKLLFPDYGRYRDTVHFNEDNINLWLCLYLYKPWTLLVVLSMSVQQNIFKYSKNHRNCEFSYKTVTSVVWHPTSKHDQSMKSIIQWKFILGEGVYCTKLMIMTICYWHVRHL